jgi:hypothetical protein
MALTLIRVNQESEPQNLTFKSISIFEEVEDSGEMKENFYVVVNLVDDELQPIENAETAKFQIFESEEAFHTNLRLESSKLNQLITSHSTNPEWNPEGYIKNLDSVL